MKLLLKIGFLLLFSGSSYCRVLYVNPNTTSGGIPPYTSRETAADSINKCINISERGDTIFLLNGLYKEQFTMRPQTSLIGESVEGVRIESKYIVAPTLIGVINLSDSCLVKKVSIFLNHYATNPRPAGAIHTWDAQLYCVRRTIIDSVIIDGVNNWVGILIGDGKISNTFINRIENAIRIEKSRSGFNLEIENVKVDGCQSYFIASYTAGSPPNSITVTVRNSLFAGYGGNHLIYTAASAYHPIYFYNNTFTSTKNPVTPIFVVKVYIPLYFINNIFYSDRNYFFELRAPCVFVNNFFRIREAVFKDNTVTPLFRYNVLWVARKESFMDSTNRIEYPMFKNLVYTQVPGLDVHLQKYSPLIDAGDPEILDADGSRSDIGAYGGPYGHSYEYEDMAPVKPAGLKLISSTIVEQMELKWERNYESDLEGYVVYYDTVNNFTVDESKVIRKTSDTVVVLNWPSQGRAYYRIKSIDRQGNRSEETDAVGIVISGREAEEGGEEKDELGDSYPNPVIGKTEIKYRVSSWGVVTLKLYDILGREVATLVNETKPTGSYSVNFNASNLPSGAYIYEMRAGPSIPYGDSGTVRLVKKMSVVK